MLEVLIIFTRFFLVNEVFFVLDNRVLIQLVEKYGLRKWSHIAQVLPGRIGKQCRERWHNHLRPDIKVLLLVAKIMY